MALSIFKKPTEPTPVIGPARAAHVEMRTRLRKLNDARLALGEKIGAAHGDITAAQGHHANVESLQEAIDFGVADQVDVSKERAALAALQKDTPAVDEKARVAGHLLRRYAAESDDIALKVKELQPEAARLLHTAVVEEMVSLKDEFFAAEQAFRDVHRRVFACAIAADRLAVENRLGQFCGSQWFDELHITRPDHAAFDLGLLPEQAQALRVADAKQTARNAEALVASLLS